MIKKTSLFLGVLLIAIGTVVHFTFKNDLSDFALGILFGSGICLLLTAIINRKKHI